MYGETTGPGDITPVRNLSFLTDQNYYIYNCMMYVNRYCTRFHKALCLVVFDVLQIWIDFYAVGRHGHGGGLGLSTGCPKYVVLLVKERYKDMRMTRELKLCSQT